MNYIQIGTNIDMTNKDIEKIKNTLNKVFQTDFSLSIKNVPITKSTIINFVEM